MAAAAAAPAAADSAKRLRLDDEPDALAAAATTPLPAPGGATLAGDAARPGEEKRQPVCRVLLYNVAKKGNVGGIIRTAVAFGASEILIVGLNKIRTFGSQGTTAFVKYLHFGAVEEAVKYLESQGSELVGVEIDASAVEVSQRPFRGDSCFVFGNEGQGLNERVKRCCHRLVYIRQTGCGTASLNVAASAAIILYHFAQWAGYPEAQREGQKYIVDESRKLPIRKPQSGVPTYAAPEPSPAASEPSAAAAVSEAPGAPGQGAGTEAFFGKDE